jgi:hypothetical protein
VTGKIIDTTSDEEPEAEAEADDSDVNMDTDHKAGTKGAQGGLF